MTSLRKGSDAGDFDLDGVAGRIHKGGVRLAPTPPGVPVDDDVAGDERADAWRCRRSQLGDRGDQKVGGGVLHDGAVQSRLQA